VRRVSNPLCGDELEIGLDVAGDRIEKVRYRARGCSICIASGSLMTDAVSGGTVRSAKTLSAEMGRWFSRSEQASEPPRDVPELLHALSPVQNYPSRKRCVLLAWEALDAALSAEAEQE